MNKNVYPFMIYLIYKEKKEGNVCKCQLKNVQLLELIIATFLTF